VTVELRPRGERQTNVKVTHEQIVDGELSRYEGGWREGLARLSALLARKN
jgi:hypothetical protein